MRVAGLERRTLSMTEDGMGIEVIDQRLLPHELRLVSLRSLEDCARAIREMWIRGAPLIGVTAAHGLWLALEKDASDEGMRRAIATLADTRPTAVNLRWALEQVERAVALLPPRERAAGARACASALADGDVETCRAIGGHGLAVLEQASSRLGGRPLHILTHCNAGWLATIDWGTALSPIYHAHRRGLPVHVWVDETRPRNQGASLTAWELEQEGVPYTLISDNAGGHLMQRGRVDLCIVGCDRVTRRGDVCNKIGTYLKALAAREHGVPFYVALPSSTVDWSAWDGVEEIPIEERDAREVTHVAGVTSSGEHATVRIAPQGARAANPAFDVTPAALVTRLITERGVCAASEEGLAALLGSPPAQRRQR